MRNLNNQKLNLIIKGFINQKNVVSALIYRELKTRISLVRFGFFGVFVYTRRHTPCFCGQPSREGAFVTSFFFKRAFFVRRSCASVGLIRILVSFSPHNFIRILLILESTFTLVQ